MKRLLQRLRSKLVQIPPFRYSNKNSITLNKEEYANIVISVSTQFNIGYQEGLKDLAKLLLSCADETDTNLASIKSLHNKHINKTGIVIGNGPSVCLADFESFKNHISFACNKFYMSYESHDFRPDYTIACDNQVIEDYGQDIAHKSSGKVIFSLDPEMNYIVPKDVIALVRAEHEVGAQLFHPTPFAGLPSMGSVVIMGIQLAYFMGCNPILVYGVDHSFNVSLSNDLSDRWRTASNDDNHFIKNYRQGRKWCPPDLPRIEEGFWLCNDYLTRHGVRIVNISRKSRLTKLPRGSVEEFFYS